MFPYGHKNKLVPFDFLALERKVLVIKGRNPAHKSSSPWKKTRKDIYNGVDEK